MALTVLDLAEEKRIRLERERSGADRYDEVWDGVYMIAPFANNEDQDLQMGLGAAFRYAVGWDAPARVHCGANVSDRENDWTQNYRIPDVVVVFSDGVARECGTHWLGGPDFCAEIISPGDRSRDNWISTARLACESFSSATARSGRWNFINSRLGNSKLSDSRAWKVGPS